MKGDFSAWRYDPLDNDQGLLFQQGRVMRDADLTESELIDIHARRQAGRDTIGADVAAVPAAEPGGFRIERARVDGGRVVVSVHPGRVWADGLLVQLSGDPADPTAVVDRAAPYLAPPANPSGTDAGSIGAGVRDAVVLEVALEELNGFQDPGRLIEPALGGPDTAERVSVRAGFRLVRLGEGEDCHNIRERLEDGSAGKGRLTARLEPPVTVAGDCPVVGGGGYTGFEHNLYRVEIADVNSGGPRFKWSQFNGGLVGRGVFHPPSGSTPARVVITGNRPAIVNSGLTFFYLEALVRDPDLGHWVVRYGAQASLNTQSDLELTTVFGSFPSPVAPETTVFFRLWNELRDVSEFTGHTPPSELRDGILLDFDAPAAATYRPGDYWVFPVRAGEITNPELLVDAAPPEGPELHRVPLAEVGWTADLDTAVSGAIEDCRRRFRPLTNQKVCCTFLVGNGVTSFGDFNSLEEAAEHLPEAGGELCLLPGLHLANLVLTARRNVRIHGCRHRTLVLPRPARPDQPVFRFQDCTNITVADLDLASFAGPILVATGSSLGAFTGLGVRHCRMVACTYGIRARGVTEVAIAHNLIWVLDSENGQAAIELRARQALVERNGTGVWPLGETPPGRGPNEDGSPDPADPCVDPGILYGRLVWVQTYLNFVWAAAVLQAPAQPYKAWGGIHLLGACEHVRLLENRIHGGLGHGVTLGGLLPGENVAPPEGGDVVEAPAVTLRARSFFAYVHDEAGNPLAGIDVYLSRNGAVAYSAASAGDTAALSIAGLPALTYQLSVEPGYELVSVREDEFEGAQYFVLVVRPAAVDLSEDGAFLYDIRIHENDIQRMGLSGIGFRPYGNDRVGIPAPNLADLDSMVAFLNAVLAPRELLGSCNLVRDLEVRGNHIHHNLLAVYDEAQRVAARRVGQGGISLALVESGIVSGNHVHDNGNSATPTCGVFVGYAEDLAVTDNRIVGNGPVSATYRQERFDAVRGGIFVRFASAFLIGGETDAFQKPALRVADNRIDQPAGRAISAVAFGPVACTDNYLNSEYDGRWSLIDAVVGGVLIVNIGGIHRQLSLASRAGKGDGTGANREIAFFNLPTAEGLLPGGETLVNGNQVRTGPNNRSFVAQLLLTLDDLGYDGNQSSAFRQDLMFGNTVCMAHSVRATDNRFRERTIRCYFSLLTYAVGITSAARLMAMNTTAHNQGDHCIFALSAAPAAGLPVVDDHNLVLDFGKRCPSEGIPAYLVSGLVATIYAEQRAALEAADPRAALEGSTEAVQQFGSANYARHRTEAKRVALTYGETDPRVAEANERLGRYETAIALVGAQVEVATIKEADVPEGGFLVDGRVADEAFRGRGNVTVGLVRADGTDLGVSGKTDEAGYFALPLDEAATAKIAAERDVRLRVSDTGGTELFRSEQPIAVEAGAPVRANVVLARRDVPLAVRAKASVIFTRPAAPPRTDTTSTPLERIKGVGPKTADRLRAAGIPDVEAFVRAPDAKLAEIGGFDVGVTRREAENVAREPKGKDAEGPRPAGGAKRGKQP